MDNGIEDLFLFISEDEDFLDDEDGAALWNALRGLTILTQLHVFGCPTSILCGLASVPQIKDMAVMPIDWNLDDDSKPAIAALEDVRIKFYCNNDLVPVDPEGMVFWKSLRFVEIEFK